MRRDLRALLSIVDAVELENRMAKAHVLNWALVVRAFVAPAGGSFAGDPAHYAVTQEKSLPPGVS